jgi:hypothetical protein
MSTANELLRRALKDLEEGLRPIRKVELIDEIRTYLATADAAEEPIAWIPEDELPERYPYNFMFQYSKVDIIRWFPVYGPPTKAAPMTEEEAIELCPFTREEFKAGFLTGVRFAEKHHGITE